MIKRKKNFVITIYYHKLKNNENDSIESKDTEDEPLLVLYNPYSIKDNINPSPNQNNINISSNQDNVNTSSNQDKIKISSIEENFKISSI